MNSLTTQPDRIITIQQIHQSAYFNEAKKRAQVPFLDHQLLECDSRGQEYTNAMHNITFVVPEGAVDHGKKIHFEVGVTMYGPFNYQEGFRPISPIVWLCLLEEDIELKKPFQLIEQIYHHNVQFAKANHFKFNFLGNQMTYTFCHCDIKPHFKSIGPKSYAVLEANHCCFYCIEAKQTHKLALDAGYSLVRVESPLRGHKNEVYFAAIYSLETCLRVCESNHIIAVLLFINYNILNRAWRSNCHVKMVIKYLVATSSNLKML